MPRTRAFAAISLVALAGCAATALNPGAERVLVTKTAAPPGCQYLGSVIGEQGGRLTGGMTSNSNLAQGALNDMKNKAHALGGNYVVLENTQAGNSMDKGTGGQTDVTHMGNAYKCSEGAGAGAPASTGPSSVRVVVGKDFAARRSLPMP